MNRLRWIVAGIMILASLAAAWSTFAECYRNTPTVASQMHAPFSFFYMLLSFPVTLVTEMVGIALLVSFVPASLFFVTLLFTKETAKQGLTGLGIRLALTPTVVGIVSLVFPRYQFPFPVLGVMERVVHYSVPVHQHTIFLALGIAGATFYCLDALSDLVRNLIKTLDP